MNGCTGGVRCVEHLHDRLRIVCVQFNEEFPRDRGPAYDVKKQRVNDLAMATQTLKYYWPVVYWLCNALRNKMSYM